MSLIPFMLLDPKSQGKTTLMLLPTGYLRQELFVIVHPGCVFVNMGPQNMECNENSSNLVIPK